MDRTRLILALALSLVVLMSWPIINHYLAPRIEEPSQNEEAQPQRAAETQQQATVPAPKKPAPPIPAITQPQAQARSTEVASREITIVGKPNPESTKYWQATLSNRGAVATFWILSKYKEDGIEREITDSDGKDGS
jgi:YidC/Oxa1 family membrane protein insertase